MIYDLTHGENVNVDLIVHKVMGFYDVSLAAMINNSLRLNHHQALARQIAMYLVRSLLDFSLKKCGHVFNRHHSTVLHACKCVEYMRDNKGFNAEIEALETWLQERLIK